MSKRAPQFERIPRDYYVTPAPAVEPLLRHLAPGTRFAEPCAGNGAMVDHLKRHGHICNWASDVQPRRRGIAKLNPLDIDINLCKRFDAAIWITNPPWGERGRVLLHALIDHLSQFMPLWALIDADWAYTLQAVPYLDRCAKIVAIGRLRWIPDTEDTGKDNSAWYLFDRRHRGGPRFYGRSSMLRRRAPLT